MPTTIKQIAALAGVSPGTVDRALHGRPGVNAAVAKRVRDIAEQCGYRPNAFAKELANTAKAKDVLVLLNARGNAYYNEVLRGMDAAEREYADYGVTVRRTLLKGYDIKGQVNALAEAKKNPPAGLIVTPADTADSVRLLNFLAEKKTLIVALNADIPAIRTLCSVGCDNYGSGAAAAELLSLMLHTRPARVAVVAGSLRQSDHKLRTEGFTDALSALPQMQLTNVLQNDDDDALSEQLMDILLSETPIDGVYFCAGGVAGGLAAIEKLPAERRPKVVTMDETEPVKSALLAGSVQATITQNPFEQGYQAVRALCEQLLFQKTPPARVTMHGEIKLRCHFAGAPTGGGLRGRGTRDGEMRG